MFNISPRNKLEREFEIAKDQGRWLSDEEWKDLEQREAIRSKLIVLTGICIPVSYTHLTLPTKA